MNDRDELIELINAADKNFTLWDSDVQEAADTILAAGYRKPRTITTAEELDALPNGTAVMDGQGEVARKLVYGWRVLVSESGFDAWLSDSLEETYLPATVLWEPNE